MKCTFISLGLSTDAIGIRILSALLKEQGHHTRLIFLPSLNDLKRKASREQFRYGQDIIDQLISLCQDSDLVGLSVMTHHYETAKALTEKLKIMTEAHIIWGGIHPTVCPEESLETAELVCVGEGEVAVVELARRIETKQSFSDIPGIWYKKNNRIVASGPGPLVQDLDSLPLLDYSFEDHFLLVEDRICPMTPENWRQHLLRFFPPLNPTGKPGYQVLSARGCPYRCTFCGEVPLENMYKNRYFRKRSVDNLIKELLWAKNTFPFIGEICFCDDTFPSRSLREIQEFCSKYKEKIDFPYYVLVSPANIKKEKFDLLVDAGLRNVGMGIQSGSPRTISLYKRDKVGGIEIILKAAKILNSYKSITPYYDFIVENPYETEEDLLSTIQLVLKLPRPMRTRVYALSFFPGTELYNKAMSDGIIHTDLYDKTFGQRSRGGYFNFLIDMTKYLTKRRFPHAIVKLLISKPFLHVFRKKGMDRVILKIQMVIKQLLFRFHISDSGLS